MLAQNFKTAADLGISEIEVDALIKVLGMLERGDIEKKQFNMGAVCGTVACIGGWAYAVSGHQAFPQMNSGTFLGMRAQYQRSLMHLFALTADGDTYADHQLHCLIHDTASPDDAALALRSYLTTGDANWAEALA